MRSNQLSLNNFLHPSNFYFVFPIEGKGKQVLDPLNQKTKINFCQISFLIQVTFCLSSPIGGRQTCLKTSKSKNHDYFSISIWALQTYLAK